MFQSHVSAACLLTAEYLTDPQSSFSLLVKRKIYTNKREETSNHSMKIKEIHNIESGFITSFPPKLYRFSFSQPSQQWPLNQDILSVSLQSFTGSVFLNRFSHGPGHGCHTLIYAYDGSDHQDLLLVKQSF